MNDAHELILFLSGGSSVTAGLYLLIRFGPGVANAIGKAMAERQTTLRLDAQVRLEQLRATERRIVELEKRNAELSSQLRDESDRVEAADARALAATHELAELKHAIAGRPEGARLLRKDSIDHE